METTQMPISWLNRIWFIHIQWGGEWGATANGQGFFVGWGEQWNCIVDAKPCEHAKKIQLHTLKREFYSMRIISPKNSKKDRTCKKTLLYKPKSLLVETPNTAVSSHSWRRF